MAIYARFGHVLSSLAQAQYSICQGEENYCL